MSGKYVLHDAGTAQFHWDLKSGNSETILSSQMYAAKPGAVNGIESCRMHSGADANYARLTAVDARPYFVLKAGNGEIIGTSQMYGSESSRDGGIEACKQNGPSASLTDNSA